MTTYGALDRQTERQKDCALGIPWKYSAWRNETYWGQIVKKFGIILLLLVGLVGAGGIWFINSDQGKGLQIGVNYTAKTLCSCMFVQEREQSACYTDMIGAVQNIPVKIDAEAKVVRASFFGVLNGEASFREGRGCTLH